METGCFGRVSFSRQCDVTRDGSEQDAGGTPRRTLDKIQMTYKIKLVYTGDELQGFLNEMEISFPGHEIVTITELMNLVHTYLVIIRY